MQRLTAETFTALVSSGGAGAASDSGSLPSSHPGSIGRKGGKSHGLLGSLGIGSWNRTSSSGLTSSNPPGDDATPLGSAQSQAPARVGAPPVVQPREQAMGWLQQRLASMVSPSSNGVNTPRSVTPNVGPESNAAAGLHVPFRPSRDHYTSSPTLEEEVQAPVTQWA
jgi:hypothetical protein